MIGTEFTITKKGMTREAATGSISFTWKIEQEVKEDVFRCRKIWASSWNTTNKTYTNKDFKNFHINKINECTTI